TALATEFNPVKQPVQKTIQPARKPHQNWLPKIQRSSGRMGNCLPKIRWKVPVSIQRKRYSHKQTQTCSRPPGTIKEQVAKKDSMNSSELWYSTVSHDVKHQVSVTGSNNETEYALISVPKRKANVTSPEEHSEYDDVLVT
ncbi:hypothetical protein Nmel_003240, partial [Mimus melanotis]